MWVLTSYPPDSQQRGEIFTHIGLIIDREPVDYLGVASFRKGGVTDRAIVRLDQIINTSERAHLSPSQLSNVMNDGLDHCIHSLMPPSFHVEQIIQINYAIHQHQVAF